MDPLHISRALPSSPQFPLLFADGQSWLIYVASVIPGALFQWIHQSCPSGYAKETEVPSFGWERASELLWKTVPGPDHPRSKEFLPKIHLNPLSFSLKPFPHIPSLPNLTKILSPWFRAQRL